MYVYLFFIKKIFFNVYLFLRDRVRQSMRRGGPEREGDTESAAGSRLRAVSTEPDAGLKLTNREIMTWAEVWRSTDWATQVPSCSLFINENVCFYIYSSQLGLLSLKIITKVSSNISFFKVLNSVIYYSAKPSLILTNGSSTSFSVSLTFIPVFLFIFCLYFVYLFTCLPFSLNFKHL